MEIGLYLHTKYNTFIFKKQKLKLYTIQVGSRLPITIKFYRLREDI